MPMFDDLQYGRIVGIIDSNDAVHSTFLPLYSRNKCATHGDLYPNQTHCRWRWSFDRGIETFRGDSYTSEELDKIQRHMNRKYRIKFWENGHHDIDYFIKQLEREEHK